MEFYKILQSIMDEKNMTVANVAHACDLSDTTVRSILARKQQKVALEVAFKLSKGLNVSLERLNGSPEPLKQMPSVSEKAMVLARKYDTLSESVQSAVTVLVDALEGTSDEIQNESNETAPAPAQRQEPRLLNKVVKRKDGFEEIQVYIDQLPAAGIGSYFDEPEYRMEQYPPGYIPPKATFGVLVSGDSMEPNYRNGATVFVEGTPTLNHKDVGIFSLDGAPYIKQFLVDRGKREVRLHSFNPKYADIVVKEFQDLRIFGRVLGSIY